jgi:hypothetical protein
MRAFAVIAIIVGTLFLSLVGVTLGVLLLVIAMGRAL